MNLNLKVYVAGHQGMVGSAIVRELLKKGFLNIITCTHSELDLINQKQVQEFFAAEKPNQVYHAAAKVGGIHANNTYPAEFIYNNLMLEANIINSAFENSVKQLLFLGSSCIYPKFAKQPLKEDYLLSGKLEHTNEAYALAKIVGLKSLEYYNRQYKTNYLALMPTNLYGPNDNFHPINSHFFPNLIRKFHLTKKNKNKVVEIWGTGKAKRDMMYVYDLADAIHFILNKLLKKDQKLRKIIRKTSFINIGTGAEYSIKYYINVIKKTINPNAKIKFNSKYPDGTPRKVLNSSIIKNLGWKPKTSLNLGLSKTYAWYIKNYKK